MAPDSNKLWSSLITLMYMLFRTIASCAHFKFAFRGVECFLQGQGLATWSVVDDSCAKAEYGDSHNHRAKSKCQIYGPTINLWQTWCLVKETMIWSSLLGATD